MMAALGSVGIGTAMEKAPMTVDVTGWLENSGASKEHRAAGRFPAAARRLAGHEKNF